MSFYVDPWLYNCAAARRRTAPAQAAEQDVIIEDMTRALDYAHGKGVTLVGAAGNNHEDLAEPAGRPLQPGLPRRATEHAADDRQRHLLRPPRRGPARPRHRGSRPVQRKKPDFSNYGTDLPSGEIEVSAPGGWFRDGFGTDTYRTNENMILSSGPAGRACRTAARSTPTGTSPRDGAALGTKKDCREAAKGTQACGYSPVPPGHLDGVAARSRRRRAAGLATRQGPGQDRLRPRPRPGAQAILASAPRPTTPAPRAACRSTSTRVATPPSTARAPEARLQRLLRQRHRQRLGRRPVGPSTAPNWPTGAGSRPRRGPVLVARLVARLIVSSGRL